MSDYFTKDTDRYIKLFIEAQLGDEKHRLFNDGIRPAFEKLIENLIYVYGFFNLDDVDTLKRDCLANLYEQLPRFNSDQGTKGFSYFNVVAKNWFIQKIRERKRKIQLEVELHYDIDHEVVRKDPNFSVQPYEDSLLDKERWVKFGEGMSQWKSKLKKTTERQVLEAVIFLIGNSDLVTIYNRKAVYLYLRELTGLSTKQVVTSLKKIKDLYVEWNNEFNEGRQ
jgi:DNA-directed RNA polymerase specialized sigma24 family protein